MRTIILILALFTVSCGRITPHRPISYKGSPLIVLDAGHGDDDPGATSKDKKVEEKNLTLATTHMTKNHLKRLGYRVLLTRSDDTFIPLTERAEIANNAHATIFVSIHYNAAKNRKAKGVEVFRFETDEDGPREIESERLAELLLASIIHYTGAENRGVKEGNLAVLRCTQMPAALVEAGFVTNREELEQLKNSKYLNSIAWGIAQGIHQYFQ